MSQFGDEIVTFLLTGQTPSLYFLTYNSQPIRKMKRLLIIASATLIAFASASAASQKATVEKSVLPEYPVEARELNLQGVVILEALVDESGKVFATDVIDSPANQLSQAAVAAVQNWEFSPATEDGQPVMQVVRIPIAFNLNDPLRDSVMAASEQAIASR